MRINSKLTGGLAWAGLILVLAVPSADILTKPQGDTANHLTSDLDPVRTASVSPAEEPAAVVPVKAGEDPVDAYVSDGKKLPSYISDAPAEVASTEPATTPRLIVPSGSSANPAPATEVASTEPATGTELVVPSGTAADETPALEVASVETAPVMTPLVAPIPYPASMRPKAPIVTATATASEADEAPLIIDEDVVARREAAVAAVLENDNELVIEQEQNTAAIVEDDELEEWDLGSLAEYLKRRGLMSEGEEQASSSEFDEDGFFLDVGPNDDDDEDRRLRRRLRRSNDFFF